MKTGIIITADIQKKKLNNFSISRVHDNTDDWIDNKHKGVHIEDLIDWTTLLVEGIQTVIYTAHDLKIKDSAEYLREIISQLESSFVIPADINISNTKKNRSNVIGTNERKL